MSDKKWLTFRISSLFSRLASIFSKKSDNETILIRPKIDNSNQKTSHDREHIRALISQEKNTKQEKIGIAKRIKEGFPTGFPNFPNFWKEANSEQKELYRSFAALNYADGNIDILLLIDKFDNASQNEEIFELANELMSDHVQSKLNIASDLQNTLLAQLDQLIKSKNTKETESTAEELLKNIKPCLEKIRVEINGMMSDVHREITKLNP